MSTRRGRTILNAIILQNNSPVITVYSEDEGNTLQCSEFGRVYSWHHNLQVSHGRKNRSNARACLHRKEPLPHTMLFADTVFNYNWQPVLVPETGSIISRQGDVVTLAFDQIGDTKGCTHIPNQHVPENRWAYRLFPMRWWDQDEPASYVFLGVWPD